MNSGTSLLQVWRTSALACFFGLLGILFHLLFVTAHLSAETEAILLGGPTGEGLGFFTICTANGISTIPRPGTTFPDSSGRDPGGEAARSYCPVCGSSSASSVLGAQPTPAVVFVWRVAAGNARCFSGREDILLADLLRHAMTCRGPPAMASWIA